MEGRALLGLTRPISQPTSFLAVLVATTRRAVLAAGRSRSSVPAGRDQASVEAVVAQPAPKQLDFPFKDLAERFKPLFGRWRLEQGLTLVTAKAQRVLVCRARNNSSKSTSFIPD